MSLRMAKEAALYLLAMLFISVDGLLTERCNNVPTDKNTMKHSTPYNEKLDYMYCYFERHHNKEILAQTSFGDPVVIHMGLYLGNIDDFDELSGILTLTLSITYTWSDGRIFWHNWSELSDIKSLTIVSSNAWLPYVYVKQSTKKITSLADDNMRLRLNSKGIYQYKVITVLSVKCDVDVLYYPFDQQTCEISMLPWGYEKTEVLLSPTQQYLNTTFLEGEDSLWEVLPSKITNQTYENHSEIKLSLHLKRRNAFHIVFIILPLVLFAIVNKFVFLLPHSSGERTGVSVTMFLAFNVYLLLANDIVPESSKPVAKLYSYLLYLLMYSAVIMILIIISQRIYCNVEHDQQGQETPVPPCISKLTTFITNITTYITCASCRTDSTPDEVEKPVTWNDVCKTFDICCFFILLIINFFILIGLIASVSINT